ncbi:MAG: hypothetical protein H6625_13075 [Bdellovibrionaceae bacterium]|nr:hypothetical protein [Pseudobdellovibrionaceae bacterium]
MDTHADFLMPEDRKHGEDPFNSDAVAIASASDTQVYAYIKSSGAPRVSLAAEVIKVLVFKLTALVPNMGYTQEELAHKIHISDRHEFSKHESLKSLKNMSADKQFRLKVLVAKSLGLKETDFIYNLNESDEDNEINFNTENLVSADEVKKILRSA